MSKGAPCAVGSGSSRAAELHQATGAMRLLDAEGVSRKGEASGLQAGGRGGRQQPDVGGRGAGQDERAGFLGTRLDGAHRAAGARGAVSDSMAGADVVRDASKSRTGGAAEGSRPLRTAGGSHVSPRASRPVAAPPPRRIPRLRADLVVLRGGQRGAGVRPLHQPSPCACSAPMRWLEEAKKLGDGPGGGMCPYCRGPLRAFTPAVDKPLEAIMRMRARAGREGCGLIKE
eukprot:749445-Hanusia_phi.AAC.4